MPDNQKYSSIKQIYKNSNTLIYKCVRYDNKPVVIKKFNKKNPTSIDLSRFQREYSIAKFLDISATINVYELEPMDDTLAIVMQDGGVSLLEIMNNGVGILERLKLAVKYADAIAKIHDEGVIHKDINPTNVVWHKEKQELKLIDFGISSTFEKENQDEKDLQLEGTLAYISPEQTGRIEYNVDQRTDLYSFGVSLYQMFTGKLPFESKEKLELIHDHIAKKPVKPKFIDQCLYRTPLLNIILNLMSKDPDDRYQNAYAVKHDLQNCLDILTNKVSAKNFSIRSTDIPTKFRLPQKLYGRESELNSLSQSLNDVVKGESKFVLVKGYSGTGKTKLVNEIRKHVTKIKGSYATGKFGHIERNIPFSAIIEAVNSIIRQILALPHEHLEMWKKRIQTVLGENAQVLLDVIPDIELLIGRQPLVPELQPKETEARLNLFFSRFISAIAIKTHPVVFFIDDVQWADTATMKLLEYLILAKPKYFLLIGAYRSNEVDEKHILSQTLERIKKENIEPTKIKVDILDKDDINNLISLTLKRDPKNTLPLAKLCYSKTGGNPFFLNQLLLSLYNRSYIYFDSEKYEWVWDLEDISEQKISDDVVEMIISVMFDIVDKSKKAICFGACIGNEFKLNTIAKIMKCSEKQTVDDLKRYVERGFLIPSHSYKYFNELDKMNHDSKVIYRFCHDRVRQAVYEEIKDTDKYNYHDKIGRELLSKLNSDPNSIYEIVKHLNYCSDRYNEKDRIRLASLNYQAGNKAKASAAWGSAYDYFKKGIELLPSGQFDGQYQLSLNLYCAVAESASLNGHYAKSAEFTKLIIDNAKNLLDSCRAYIIDLNSLVAQGRHKEAIDLGIHVISKLGIDLPKKTSKLNMLAAILRTWMSLRLTNKEKLCSRKPLKDEKMIAAANVMMVVTSSAYICGSPYFVFFLGKIIHMLIHKGNHKTAAYGCSGMAVIICGIMHDYNLGNELAMISEKLTNTSDAIPIRPKCGYINCVAVKPWKKHYSETAQELLDSYNLAKECGDIEYAALSILGHCYTKFWLGTNLYILKSEMAKYGEEIKQQSSMYSYFKNYQQIIEDLISGNYESDILSGNIFDEKEMLPLYEKENNTVGIVDIYGNKLFLYYLYNKYSEAYDLIPSIDRHIKQLLSKLNVPVVLFYKALTILSVYESQTKRQKKISLKIIKTFLKKIKKWEKHSPRIFENKLAFIKAEIARINGNDAEIHYNKAIELSDKNGFIQEGAIFSERAAEYLKQNKKNENIANIYLLKAYEAYRKWGASTKCAMLADQYPKLIKKETVKKVHRLKKKNNDKTITTTSEKDNVDIISAMKAAQIMSNEMDKNKLSHKLLKVIVINSGADRAILLINKNGKYEISSMYEQKTGDGQKIKEKAEVPEAVINYISNSKRCLVIYDAVNDSAFNEDDYIIKNEIKSILCLPLLRKDEITGMMYLENRLIPGIFTEERVKLLQILASQYVMTMENAKLYALQLEKRLADAKAATERQFLAHMSHEIRTPLNTILGYTSLLSEAEDAKRKEYTENIETSGRHLLSLVNDVLDISKMEHGRIKVKKAPMLILSLKEKIQTQFGRRYKEKGLALSIKIDEKVQKISVDTDEGKIYQIVANLLDNSLKYTETGYVKLAISGSFKADNEIDLDISVEDSGIGIKDTKIIFENFEQINDQKDIIASSGFGLGLAIVKKLVEVLSGTVDVQSVPGIGSKFIVKIPDLGYTHDIGKKEIIKIPDLKENIKFEKATILVADDNEKNRNLIKDYLKGQPLKILMAINGEAAMKIIKEENIDLVLLDLKMPRLNGINITKMIKNDKKLSSIPVIIITADITKESKKENEEVGCDAYLLKPISRQTLHQTMKKYLPNEVIKEKSKKERLINYKGFTIPENYNIELLNKLAGELNQIKEEKWEKVEKTMIYREIENFSKDVESIGKKYEMQSLIEWSADLGKNAKSYNINETEKLIAQFGEIMQIIEKRV